MKFNILHFIIISSIIWSACTKQQKVEETENPLVLEKISDEKPKNVIFILSDDHRYDFMGFTGKVPFLKTPAMDKMATEGIHFRNAFVTTSLCSPSRASILTGQFSHHHGVVDNQAPIADSVRYFPQYLQEAGYATAFIGKWHMGHETSEPRKGFDQWISFRGQGQYYNPTININGEEKPYGDSTYITDLLTDFAMEFLRDQEGSEKPFFMYLSHKGVHAEFRPAKRHQHAYDNEKVSYPPTMFPDNNPDYNYELVPDWVKEQRYSWHGVDYMYHGQTNFENFYKDYCETLLSIDESIQTILNYLEENNLLEDTYVFYMGDNGFSFGEHGLIDKRHAYEESIRVPLLLYGAGSTGQSALDQMIQNIDIGPTILQMAGLAKPKNMDGESFLPMVKGENIPWRERIYYEYFWERPFPQTPTVHAVRTDSFKYIRYHGIWDINELYDLKNDPWEMNNLIRDTAYFELTKQLNSDIFTWLTETNGLYIPLRQDYGTKIDHKYRGTY